MNEHHVAKDGIPYEVLSREEYEHIRARAVIARSRRENHKEPHHGSEHTHPAAPLGVHSPQ
jgi:hypothetical protein